MLVYIFIALGVVFLILFILSNKKSSGKVPVTLQEPKQQKKFLGEIQVLYASQTGTAAKMANTFAEEAADHGFRGIVVNLKDLSHNEFKKNQISVFFMANTGQGDPPQNSVAFMKLLKGKLDLQGSQPQWQNMNYTVFGLGDTQYEHFNKIGIDTDTNLQKLGAKRLFKIGLGDANSSMEDDYNEWKAQLWPILVQFRQMNPYQQVHQIRKLSTHLPQSQENIQYLNEQKPIYANYRFCVMKQKVQKKVVQDDLDFKTKASLSGKQSRIERILQKRQNKEAGSSLQLQIQLENQPQYQTASNVALWPSNDPIIVEQVYKYFNVNPETIVDIQVIDPEKRTKLNFVAPTTIKKLVEESIDLQFRITKSVLKKLSKLPSKSPDYFLTNSSAKTTDQYKRLSQSQFNYLFKLIKDYQVKITLQDFVQLSDSMGPRLFTIASSYKAQKNVVVIASIVENGLISKNFIRNPVSMKAQLRKSTFVSIQRWKKVIFIGAGTGFAPFRGYLQQKELAIKQNKQFPIISVYFGCKKSNSDFIYKEQMLKWEKQGIINKLNLAFSIQTQTKIYVQNLLQNNEQELNQYINDPETAMYICGSLAMGRDVVDVLQRKAKKSAEEFKALLTEYQKRGKLIKELW